MNIKKALTIGGLKAKKIAPHAMVVLGLGGIIYTLVDACIISRRIDDEIEDEVNAVEDAKVEFEDALEAFEEVCDDEHKAIFKNAKKLYRKAKNALYKKILRYYLKTIILGLLSVALIGGGHIMITGRLIATTATLVALESDYKDYRKAVRERFGEQVEDEIMYGRQMREAEVTKTDPETGEETIEKIKVAKWREDHSVYALAFCKTTCGSMFTGNKYYDNLTISNMTSMLERKYDENRFVFVEKAYEYLHHKITKEIIGVGWIEGNPIGDGYIKVSVVPTVFEFEEGKQEDGYIIDFNVDGRIDNYLDSVMKEG